MLIACALVVATSAHANAQTSDEEAAAPDASEDEQHARQEHAAPDARPPDDGAPEEITLWLGARYAGTVFPQFLMNAFGDGGATFVVPGVAATATLPTAGPELVFSLGFASYRLDETAYKPSGTPDTDYEIIESDLKSFVAAIDVMWALPLADDDTVSFRVGASVGIGFMVLGNLVRTQSHPPDGVPGDPDTYVKCRGPNDPAGTFRYCNQLDKDADHYDFYKEPNWFEGGARPLIYPWLAVPIGLTFKPLRKLAIDVETGFSVGGFLMNVGARYGI